MLLRICTESPPAIASALSRCGRATTAVCLLLLLLTTAEIGAEDWVPGQEKTWHRLGKDIELRVYVPEDYTPERAWPLIYSFHGTGGKASNGMMRTYTQGRGFVLVGGPYAVPGAGSLSREGVLQEVRRIRSVRSLLGDSLNLDDRTYVAGFSKGGWMSDLLATEGFPTLAGAMILGAGRIPQDVGLALERPGRTSALGNRQPLSIYVGIGQLDTNHVYSRRAVQHYEASKHAVVFEEYYGRGHQSGGENARALFQFLDVERLRGEPEERRLAASRWWDAAIEHSESIASAIERLVYLEATLRAPFAAFVSTEKRAKLRRSVERARVHRSLKRELEARRAYESAQGREREAKRSDALPGVASAFARVVERFPGTFYGDRAALDIERVARNYRTLRAGTESRGSAAVFPRATHATAETRKRFERFGALFSK